MRILFSFLLFLGLIISESQGQTWRAIEMAPMPMKISNNAVTEAFVGNAPYVYSFAGIDSTKVFSGITNASFRYNVNLDQWDSIPPLPDSRTKIAAAASYVNGLIYIIGGYTVFSNGNEISSNRIHRFDPNTNTYLSDGPNIPVPIDDHVQVVYKDSLIYVVTGWSNTTNVSNVQIYDTYLNSWSTGTPVPSTVNRVFGSTGVIIGDTIYYFGGAAIGSNFPTSNYLRRGVINPNNPTQISWQSFVPAPLVRSYRPGATAVNNIPYWIGGSSVSYNYNGIAYNGSGGVSPSNWSISFNELNGQLTTAPPDTGFFPMDLRGVASISNTVKYIAGGMLNNQVVTDKTYRLEYQLLTNLKEAELSFIEVYPNPANDFINLRSDNGRLFSWEVYDALGRLVDQQSSSLSVDQLDVSSWDDGLYLLRLFEGDRFEVRKLMVMH